MSHPAREFDDRESFRVAEAVLAVVRRHHRRLADDEAVWEAFISWRGSEQAEYLRRIRAGGKHVFYDVLVDLYRFARELCGEGAGEEVGRQLAGTLLERHMPDLLHTALRPSGSIADQIMWLLDQFVTGACGEVYQLDVEARSGDSLLSVIVRYKAEDQFIDYLSRRGHVPERVFANSFAVFRGAVPVLLARVVHGFVQEQFTAELMGQRGRLAIEFREGNRFHHENVIGLLLDYVGRIRERATPETPPAAAEAALHASQAMKRTWDALRKAAASDETVLLCGESGTGKSYHARLIHELSRRRDGPFIEVGLTADVGADNLIQSNLFGHVRGAFTGADEEKQGLFALADGGTIFLDEVGDASPELQARLLRVIDRKIFKKLGGLQDIAVDVRIIIATNRDLAKRVEQGRFREDLYYRLNVLRIAFPPLRERAADLPALVHRLLETVCRQAGRPEQFLADEAFAALCAYSWPGNIRELENALRHAVAFADSPEIGLADLPDFVRRAAPSPRGGVVDRDALRRILAASQPASPTHAWPGHIDHAKREYLIALIEHYGGRIGEIARHWDRSSENTLLKLVRELGLEAELQTARRARP